MREYDEVTQTVLRRRDEMIARDRRRNMILKRSALAAMSVCAAVGVAVFCRNIGKDDFSDNNIVIEQVTVSTTADNNVITTTASSDNKAVNATTAVTDTKKVVSSETAAVTGKGSTLTTAASPYVHTAKSDSIPAAVTTAVPQTTAIAATNITTSVYHNERSTYMKKLMPFAASLVMMANAAEMPVVAAESDGIYGRMNYDDFSIFAEMDNGDLDTDIDMDGEFTIKDSFDLFAYYYKYELPQDEIDNIIAKADYDGNGKVEHNDCELLLKYVINKNMIRKEQLLPSYYADFDRIMREDGEPIYGPADQEAYDIINSEDFDKGAYTPEEFEELAARAEEQTIIGYETIEYRFSDIYLSYLRTFLNDLNGSYGLFCNCVKNGDIELDINSDGEVTFEDINIYKYFTEQSWLRAKIERNHEWIDSLLPYDLDPEGLLALRDPDFVSSITDDEWAVCKEDHDFFTELLKLNDMDRYAVQYLLERDGRPDDKYFDNDYYESVLTGSGKLYFGEYVRSIYDMLYPVSEKMTLDKDELYRCLDGYCEKIVAKEIDVSDATGDGVIDYKDIFISDIYLYDCKNSISREDSYVPESVWDFFETKLDLNDNGVFGDICDVSIYQIGVYAYIGTTPGVEIPYEDHDDYSRLMKEYRSELKAAKEAEANKLQTAPADIADAETDERSGDANCDTGVDLADTVMIMQSMANPNKYPMSPIGRYNADVYKPGSGVTVEDALAIQIGLLNGKY